MTGAYRIQREWSYHWELPQGFSYHPPVPVIGVSQERALNDLLPASKL